MKNKVTLGTTLFILGMLALLALGGCEGTKNQSVWVPGQPIPWEIEYNGYNYKSTGETIASIKITPDNLQFIGHGVPLPGNTTPSPTGECPPLTVYEVYSIKGIDKDNAIAVEFEMFGNGEVYNVFWKYQRE